MPGVPILELRLNAAQAFFFFSFFFFFFGEYVFMHCASLFPSLIGLAFEGSEGERQIYHSTTPD